MEKIKLLFLETRPHFLVLSLVLSFLGNCIAWYEGRFDFLTAIISTVGLVFAHISVNVLNDYFDYHSGIDLNTQRTPFSGGSGILPQELLKPSEVLWLGLVSLFVSMIIGVYFVFIRGWLLLPLLLIAILCVVLYTPVILRTKYPEWAAGLGLGILPILGTYFAQTGKYSVLAFVCSIPSGILVHNLLFLNEFPDIEADKKGGRQTLPIVIGKRKAATVYCVLTILVFLWILGVIILRLVPIFGAIALFTFPLALRAIKGALNPDDPELFLPALSANVLVIMLTQALLGFGFILAGLI